MCGRGPIARAAAFARGDGAGLTVETVIVFPFLLWALAAIHVFWDAYRADTASLKATYTVADLISRGTSTLDQAYLDGMRGMLDALAGGGRAGGAGRDGPAALRVSVVRNPTEAEEPDEDALWLEWSHVSGQNVAEVADIAEIRAHVPTLAEGDRAVVLETLVPWSPLIELGLPARRFQNVAVTRPRFGGRVCWESCSPS